MISNNLHDNNRSSNLGQSLSLESVGMDLREWIHLVWFDLTGLEFGWLVQSKTYWARAKIGHYQTSSIFNAELVTSPLLHPQFLDLHHTQALPLHRPLERYLALSPFGTRKSSTLSVSNV